MEETPSAAMDASCVKITKILSEPGREVGGGDSNNMRSSEIANKLIDMGYSSKATILLAAN